jgi:hypothetical protein
LVRVAMAGKSASIAGRPVAFPMLVAWYRELLEAAPPLSAKDVRRLSTFTPQRTAMSVAVEMAYWSRVVIC